MTARRAVIAACATSIILGALVARMWIGARTHYQQGKRANDPEHEIVCYRRAISYYFPGNPWVDRAQSDLATLASKLETAGKLEQAYHAWSTLRGVLLSLRGLTVPYSQTRATAERALARLHQRRVGGNSDLSPRLRSPDDPSRLWTTVGLVGFGTWILGSFILIFCGLSPQLSRNRLFWPLATTSGTGFLLFAIGMALA